MLAVDGVSARDIHSSLRSILSETDAGDIAIKREGADRNSTLRTHAVVRPTGMNGFDLWQMENSFIRMADRDVRASDFMQICRREAKNCIPREKQEYVLRVAFNVLGSYTYTSRYIKQVTEKFNDLFPVGFRCIDRTYGSYDDDGTQYWLIGLMLLCDKVN